MDMESFEGWALRPAEFRRYFPADPADHLGSTDAVLLSADDVDSALADALGPPRTFWLAGSLMHPVESDADSDEDRRSSDAAESSSDADEPLRLQNEDYINAL